MAIDVVCGKEVDEAAVNAPSGQVFAGAKETDPQYGTKRFYGGKWYYFCSLGCRQKFIAHPDEYIHE